MNRIGVFVCHCGDNIAGTVDVERVAKEIAKYDGVAHSVDYTFMCSDPGQKLIKTAIQEKNLDGVIVASCSPTMHEGTFRKAAASAGLNPYQCEIANIREQCSWVHSDKEKGTQKAILIIKSMIEKLKMDESLYPVSMPTNKNVLVIGAGIAGIQAALDIAEAGHKVFLVEKRPYIGGHMIQLSVTFPTLDCSQCILTPKMVQVDQDENIELFVNSEVESIDGAVGNFKVKIKRKAQYINPDICTGCGDCVDTCPVLVPDEYEEGLSYRKAVYMSFPQVIPYTYTLDIDSCLGLDPIACGKCKEACKENAINYDLRDEIIEKNVGAVIVATGYDQYSMENIGEYGYGKYPDVVSGLQFERLIFAVGPSGGKMLRPSDGKPVKEIAFIQCAGSRDPERHLSHCSKICCMYTAKQAKMFKTKVPDGQAYIYYIDTRAAGKDYEEFLQKAQSDQRLIYIRGKVSRIYKENDKMAISAFDTLSGKKIDAKVDMVVLALGLVPSFGTAELARKFNLSVGTSGFLSEAHPKLRPVESVNSGFFLAGTCLGPKDIPETVAQASGAASKALSLLAHDSVEKSPIIVQVDAEKCDGCGKCAEECIFDAITIDKIQNIAVIDEMKCKGCGYCIPECPYGAIEQKNLSDLQIYNMINAILTKGKKTETFEPKIICFLSEIGPYQAADLAGTGRMQYRPNAFIIKVLSISMLNENHILYALKNGADGVLISGSHPGESPYPGASLKAKERIDLIKSKVKNAGLDPNRIRLEWYAGRQGKGLATYVDNFVEYLKMKGPVDSVNWKSLN